MDLHFALALIILAGMTGGVIYMFVNGLPAGPEKKDDSQS